MFFCSVTVAATVMSEQAVIIFRGLNERFGTYKKLGCKVGQDSLRVCEHGHITYLAELCFVWNSWQCM